MALLHGPGVRANPPLPPLVSFHFDAVGHPETGHPVEDLAGEFDLDSLASERSAPHPLTKDSFVPEHGVLHQASSTVA